MAATTPSNALAPPPPDENDGGKSRLGKQVHSTEKMPGGHDEEIAVIFREMRHALNVPTDQLAARLKTPVDTLEALEAGNFAALPDWHETSRIIAAYTQILGLDSRPILRRLKMRLGADASTEPGSETTPAASAETVPAAAPASPPKPPGVEGPSAPAAAPAVARESKQAPAQTQAPTPQKKGRQRQRRRSMSASAWLSWLLLMAFFAAMAMGVVYLVANPRTVWTTVESLPEPLSRGIRSVWELVRPLDENAAGTVIVDPNKHKSDKLPQSPRN